VLTGAGAVRMGLWQESAKYERDSAYIHEMYVLVESPDRVLSDAASKAVLEFLDERGKEAPLVSTHGISFTWSHAHLPAAMAEQGVWGAGRGRSGVHGSNLRWSPTERRRL
jgi:hypothetical protein